MASIPAFPGPQTFFSSREGWWGTTVKGALGTAYGIFMIVIGAPLAFFVTAPFCFLTIIGVMMLLPGSSSLRLSESGFEVTTLFAFRRTYRWCNVSDIEEGSILGKSRVVFETQTQHLGAYGGIKAALTGKLNAALTRGHNGFLPDNYGMSADDLARLMASWRRFSMAAR